MPAAPTAEDYQVLGAVNDLRRARGLHVFSWSNVLWRAAVYHSEEQHRHGYMGHDGKDSRRRRPMQRMEWAGYRGAAYGEVVAWNYRTVAAVVRGWMNSPSHRAILLDREMREAAFSRVGRYWTGNFGAPRVRLRRQQAPVRGPQRVWRRGQRPAAPPAPRPAPPGWTPYRPRAPISSAPPRGTTRFVRVASPPVSRAAPYGAQPRRAPRHPFAIDGYTPPARPRTTAAPRYAPTHTPRTTQPTAPRRAPVVATPTPAPRSAPPPAPAPLIQPAQPPQGVG